MKNPDNLELLITTTDEYIINQVKAILDDNNIPYIQKDHNTGGYMRIIGNTSIYPTDIFVSENNIFIAKELINFLVKE